MENDAVEPLSHSDFAILAKFRYTLRKFIRFSEEAATANGLTAQQYQALLAIKGAESLPSIGYLAEQLQLRHHTAVELVNRLAERGLIERRASATDRRRVDLVLTADGDRNLSELAGAHREELRKIGPQIQELLEQIHSR